MANREITIRISAQDSFSSILAKYNQEMGLAEQNTRKVAQTNSAAESSFSGLMSAVQGVVGVLSVQAVVGAAENMNALGVQVHANQVLFEQLTQSIGGSDEVLRRLQDATGGVVDNMALMQGANQLLRLGVVDTASGLEDLVGKIQRLKQPTESTTDAINNFALMLSNQSLLRLDSFGISSAKVRDRMEELKQTGLDTAAAFKQATFEQMQAQLDRLGPAADIAETALGRLQTRLANLSQQASENFAVGVEATVNLVDQVAQHAAAGDLIDRLTGKDTGAEQQVYARGVVIAQQFEAGFQSGLDPQAIQDFITNYLRDINAAGGQLPDLSPENIGKWAGFPISGDSPLFQELQHIAIFTTNQNAELDRAAEIQAHTLEIEKQRAAVAQAMVDYRKQERDFAQQQATLAAHQAQVDALINPIDQIGAQLQQMYGGANGSLNGIILFTPEQAQRAQIMADKVAGMVEDAKAAHDNGLIDDAQFALINGAAKDIKGMADDMERGAAAFSKMNLSDILGTGGGGVLGEITDKLTAAAQAQGMTGEQIQKLQDAFDLASGRQTGLSQAFDQNLIPQLLSMNPEDAVKAAEAWTNAMKEARLEGIPQQALIGGMNMFAGITGGGAGMGFTVKPGQGINEILAQYPGLTREQLMGAAGTANGRFILPGSFTAQGGGMFNEGLGGAEGLQTYMDILTKFQELSQTLSEGVGGGLAALTSGESGGTMKDNMQAAADTLSTMTESGDQLQGAFDAIAATLDAIASKTINLNFNVLGIPDWLQAAMQGNNSGINFVQNTVTQNNGVVPGTRQGAGRGRSVTVP